MKEKTERTLAGPSHEGKGSPVSNRRFLKGAAAVLAVEGAICASLLSCGGDDNARLTAPSPPQIEAGADSDASCTPKNLPCSEESASLTLEVDKELEIGDKVIVLVSTTKSNGSLVGKVDVRDTCGDPLASLPLTDGQSQTISTEDGTLMVGVDEVNVDARTAKVSASTSCVDSGINEAGPDSDGGVEADAEPDALPDVLPDTEPDVLPDVAPDTEPDVAPDVMPDTEPDVIPDVVPDVDDAGDAHDAVSEEGGSVSPWSYCRDVAINGSYPADYSHELLISGLNGAEADGKDVRVVSGNCSDIGSELGMYLESFNASGQSKIWFKTPSAMSGVAVLYGNPNATSVSDGDAVFLLFDGFDGSALDTSKWTHLSLTSTCSIDTIEVSGGKVTLEAVSSDFNSPCNIEMKSVQEFLLPMRVDFIGMEHPNWNGTGSDSWYRSTLNGFGMLHAPRSGFAAFSQFGRILNSEDGPTMLESGDMQFNPAVAHDATLVWTSANLTYGVDGSQKGTLDASVPATPLPIFLYGSNWRMSYPSAKIVVDEIRGMKYADPAPTYTISSEKQL